MNSAQSIRLPRREFRPVKPQPLSVGRLLFPFVMYGYGLATGGSLQAILLTTPVFLTLVIWQYFNRDRNFNSDDMFCFCALLFFVLSPLQILVDGVFDNGGAVSRINYSNHELLVAYGIVFIFIISLGLGRFTAEKMISGNISRGRNFEQISGSLLVAGAILALICTLGFILTFGGVQNVMAPRNFKTSSSAGIFAFGFLGVLVVINVIMGYVVGEKFWKKNQQWPWFLVLGCTLVTCACLFFCVNPLNMSRFVFVGSWLPFFLALLGRKVSSLVVIVILLLGLLVVMPVMSMSSRWGSEAAKYMTETGYSTRVAVIKDVDVMDTLTHSVKYTEINGHLWGDNVLAVVLFFVPRVYWPEKPQVGGLLIGEDLCSNYGAGTSNLSYFFAGDLYMDFSWAGVIAGGLILGFIWDRYRRINFNLFSNNVFDNLLVGSLPILMRGPLGAVIGFFVCVFIALILVRFSLGRVGPAARVT